MKNAMSTLFITVMYLSEIIQPVFTQSKINTLTSVCLNAPVRLLTMYLNFIWHMYLKNVHVYFTQLCQEILARTNSLVLSAVLLPVPTHSFRQYVYWQLHKRFLHIRWVTFTSVVSLFTNKYVITVLFSSFKVLLPKQARFLCQGSIRAILKHCESGNSFLYCAVLIHKKVQMSSFSHIFPCFFPALSGCFHEADSMLSNYFLKKTREISLWKLSQDSRFLSLY